MSIASNYMKDGAKMSRPTDPMPLRAVTIEIRSCDGDQYVKMNLTEEQHRAIELFAAASDVHGGGCTPSVSIVTRKVEEEWEDVTHADDLDRLKAVKAEKDRIAKLAEARRTKAGLKDLEELGLL